MTQRSAFVLRIRPDKLDAYVEAHREVWPEMLDALRGAGIRNYTIFRAGNQAFGYFECDDLQHAGAYLAEQEVSAHWQDRMAELLEERVPVAGPPPPLGGSRSREVQNATIDADSPRRVTLRMTYMQNVTRPGRSVRFVTFCTSFQGLVGQPTRLLRRWAFVPSDPI